MPPPKSKEHIITRLKTERRRLEQNLALLSPEEQVLPGVVGEWSVKDVLAHLADWEAHMPVWLEAARRGQAMPGMEPGIGWREFDALNVRIYERHRGQSLEEVLAYFRETHRQFMAMVEAMPEAEILEPGHFTFVGKGTVHDWLSAYACHDLWAKRHLRRWIRQRRAGIIA